MAQLKNSTVTGSLRVTDTIYSTIAQFERLKAPTTSGGSTFGPGTAGQVLRTNGTTVFWDTVTGATGHDIYYLEDSRTGDTSELVNTLTSVSELYDGLTICYYFKYPTAADMTLTLTLGNGTTVAEPMYATLDTELGTQITAQTTAFFTWMSNATTGLESVNGAAGRWMRFDNASSAYVAYHLRFNIPAASNLYIMSNDLSRYKLVATKADKTLLALCGSSSSSGTSKTNITTDNFDPFGTFWYYNTTTTVASGSSAGYTNMYYCYQYFDMRYTFNCGSTATVGAPLYLVASIQNNNPHTAALRNPGYTGTNAALGGNGPLSHTLPSSNDGYIYIYIGNTRTNNSVQLSPWHPVYKYIDGAVHEMTPELFTEKSSLSTTTEGGRLRIQSQDGTKTYVINATTANNQALCVSELSTGATATLLTPGSGNDYAEYRTAAEKVEYGQCVIDNNDGTVSIAQKRMMPGASVVSDTWGYIMGQKEPLSVPIAVAGRVLVKPFLDKSIYHAGQCVCTAPNGTVDIMSREEIRYYPDCIVGIVSEIPEYEYWGKSNIKVDNRIWIKVK